MGLRLSRLKTTKTMHKYHILIKIVLIVIIQPQSILVSLFSSSPKSASSSLLPSPSSKYILDRFRETDPSSPYISLCCTIHSIPFHLYSKIKTHTVRELLRALLVLYIPSPEPTSPSINLNRTRTLLSVCAPHPQLRAQGEDSGLERTSMSMTKSVGFYTTLLQLRHRR